jgi:hypothetical protein
MGMFDYVHVDERFTCPDGHSLADMEFQTKDLDCTLGSIELIGERVQFVDSMGLGAPHRGIYTGPIEFYGSCERCPAFVQAETFNLIDFPVWFAVWIVEDEIRDIKRVSPSLGEWLHSEPRQPHMHNCRGPMSHDDAKRARTNRSFFPWDTVPTVEPEVIEAQVKWRAEMDAMRAKYAKRRSK